MKNKYGKNILDNSLSAGKDFAKIAGKKVLTKSAEASGDLIGNKIADRITKSARNKEEKEDDRIMEETQEIIIPPEKREQIIRDSNYKMEYDKINNLLLSEDNESEVSKANRANEMSEKLSKFVTREYVGVNSLSNTYNENKSIRFKTPMLRSNLCDYSGAYILVKGAITVTAPGANNIRDRRNRPLILKNNAPFVSCITRINGELIEDADDLDIVIPMYNLLEYSKNYRKTIGSLYNYYRGELSHDADDNNFDNIKVVNSNTFNSKNKIIGNTYNVNAGDDGYDVNKNGTQEVELTIPLKYLGNFWRALNIPLISCEVSLELK